ncbi:MAG: YfhO family protein [Acetatifactor sp.]|nr:YfhO family protein [Acetatifactor sp.]
MKNVKIRRERAVLLLAFFLPVAVMLCLFIINGIYPFGGNSFLSGDLYHQYMPFFSELLHKVRGGESLDFSFNVGIGSNFLALFVYYLASPFHILALPSGGGHLVEFIGYLVVFKTGLCGLTACYYFQKHFDTKDGAVLLFSMFYAFSGFMAAYNYNIMWLDCIWVLPLILLGLERLVKEGKCALYCLTLAFSIYTNFYLSIMICIFLVLYFAVLLVTERKNRLRSIGYFALFSVLAGGMAAILLIPEVRAILQTDFGETVFPKKVESYFSVLDMLARHCVCVYTERGLDHWPNIYCGSAVLMLIPMYLMNRRISIREKFCRLALAGFMLLSFSTNILNFIWHGLNYPDSLPARQSFIYVFLVLTMCYDAYRHLQEVEGQQILYGYLCATGFLLFCEKFISHEDFELGVKLLTLLFITIYAILLYLYRTRRKENVRLGIAVVALVLVLAECGINTWDTSIGTTDRAAYLSQQEDYKALYELTGERTEGFYRVEKFTRKTKNDATLTGYPSASVFSSTLNSDVMDLYKRLGMRHSKVYYSFDGATGLTSALLNVNYMFGESDAYECGLYTKLAQSGDIYLYECNAVLPFGYVAPVGFDIPEGFENQAVNLQNRIVRELGASGQLFRTAEKTVMGDDIQFTPKEGGIYYAMVTASGTGKIQCIGGSRDEETFGDLKRGCILYLGYLEKGQTITLTNGDEKDETPKISADIYRMDEEVLRETLGVLAERHLENVEWESDFISGRITLDEPGRLILSIPYEDGWTVRMNGEKVEGELFGGCLMAFDLEPGTYEIEMKYRAAGAVTGIIVTVVSIAVFAGVMVLKRCRMKAVIGQKRITKGNKQEKSD